MIFGFWDVKWYGSKVIMVDNLIVKDHLTVSV